MTVTQDYKILTLTRKEYDAVRLALSARKRELQECFDGETDAEYIKMLETDLAIVQSALAKVSNIVVAEILVADACKSADNYHFRDVSRAVALERAKVSKQAFLDRVPFVIGEVAGKNGADFLGGRVYSLQDLFKLGAHFSSNKKIASVAA